jgi:site-specific DNA recombinase
MKKNSKKILVADKNELPGLIMAYEKYATGNHSDNSVAELLNEAGYRSKTGRPFSKETVRDILQNQTYLGKTKYQKYKRRSDGSRSYEAPIEWFDGQHKAVIDEALFEKCQQIRAERRRHRKPTPKFNPYLLRDLVYCYDCCSNQPKENTFRNYGKLRPQAQSKGKKYRYYRCRSKELGYTCSQKAMRAEELENQVINILMQLKPPKEWRKGITKAMSDLLGEKNLEERLEEIRGIIKRMDARWDHGFIIDEQEYLENRMKLQLELEQLNPVSHDDLEQAADLLENFKFHWERLEGDDKGQQELVSLIVERIYVADREVKVVTLRSNYHLVLGHKTNGPTYQQVDPFLYQYGSDGDGPLTCKTMVVIFVPRCIHQENLLSVSSFSDILSCRQTTYQEPIYS